MLKNILFWKSLEFVMATRNILFQTMLKFVKISILKYYPIYLEPHLKNLPKTICLVNSS
jgi:hypothetical protein